MISYDFEYYRPETYEEALSVFSEKHKEGKNPLYYNGGTETVTYARKKLVNTGALIDIKSIPECTAFSEDGDKIVYGSALDLNYIIEKSSFKLMGDVSRKIADHTVRNKLSLGGNICGRLFYREAILPIMLAEGTAIIATNEGIIRVPVLKFFDKKVNLKNGELLLQIEIDKKHASFSHYNERKEKQSEIDYPLFHLAAMKTDQNIRFAFSGICAYPFRSLELEAVLNDKEKSFEDRASYVIENLPSNARNDMFASGDFRKYLLKNSIVNALKKLEGGLK
ncbi:CO or xanthine dehydrogenase, FAD-binding subunit [Proteiniborus ethanoligenes]|uniref:CO or xanthine dehydrogenase, FAD-binding subunit n=1 Tax=Proteiniborus ethanoligenes TaxID=415015 RepID=A0A1H3ML51_9FIRM|nr:FAD binding domain-containing protein [Proteiniborus ethanoligenes]SDY76855.1 CO or xanthine dehydrogenase, FAD-binding subunit [Proteiniborus ethanoligenes]